MRSRLLWVGILVLASVAYLAYSSWQGAALYYLTPAEAVEQYDSLKGRLFRLAGTVAVGTVDWDPEALALSFDVVDGSATVHVVYRGAEPDGFAAGRQVVVEGSFDEKGRMAATRLIIKCPSKYEQAERPADQDRTADLYIGVAVVVGASALAGAVAFYLNRANRSRGREPR